MNKNRNLDYSLRYIRIDPSVTLTFDHPFTSGVTSSLALKGFLINEEVAEFESANVLKGINSVNSTIFRLDYQLKKDMALSTTSLWLSGEQQSYGQQNYIKLSAILNQRLMYASRKNLYFRIFSAGFLSNTQRQSNSFQNVFTKGSIAMIHQGFNDYTYDEYFFSRQNQSRLYDNQVSMNNGGGFKTPIGSAYSLGMSNHFATSVNFSSDIPILPVKLPIRIYFDAGTYSTYSGSRFSNNVIYNGGLSLHISEVINIYIPLIYSSALGNIYKGQHAGFLSRISFGIDLHQLDPWKF
ncbi:MAG: hypothetical protein WBO36_05300 [Saprospiraceae bacterium]